jgi:hypothetical protein
MRDTPSAPFRKTERPPQTISIEPSPARTEIFPGSWRSGMSASNFGEFGRLVLKAGIVVACAVAAIRFLGLAA